MHSEKAFFFRVKLFISKNFYQEYPKIVDLKSKYISFVAGILLIFLDITQTLWTVAPCSL